MAKGFKHGAGGGGASLNFKVVGNPQPENPKENTIWLDTDVKVTGWNFSKTEPENPSDGMVWIPIGTSSLIGFNALKKNCIMVYPKSAKQYVDGAWADVTAKIWQNEEWANWAQYIFQSGKGAIVPIEHFQCNRANSSHTDDSIVHTRYDSGSDFSATSTADAVDLNGYSMLYARAKCTSQLTGGREQCIGLSSKKPGNFTATGAASARPDIALTSFVADSAVTVYSLPIPSGLESAFIWIHGNGNAEVYDIWME